MKKIFVGLLVFTITLLVILFANAQTLSSEYVIEANEVMDAPTNDVYALISNLKSWEKWSPWKEMDSTMVLEFSKNEGPYAVKDWLSWQSKSGNGKMIISENSENSFFSYTLSVEGMSSSSNCYFSLSNAENKTFVIWSMKGSRTSLEKVFWLYLGIEEDIQEHLKRGLGNIKKLAENKS